MPTLYGLYPLRMIPMEDNEAAFSTVNRRR
jgi:hypothetical protein